jgi:serine protease Do
MKLRLISFILITILSSILFFGCRKTHENRQRGGSNYVATNSHSRDKERQPAEKSRIQETKPKHRRNNKVLSGAEIFEEYASAVFMVFTSDGNIGFQGSGFFIDNKGLAVSNYHVFKGTTIGKEKIKLLGSDIAYNVSEIIEKNSDSDFILFRVDCTNNNYIPIAKSKPKVGEKVFAIGSPRGLENTFSSGEVSQWRGNYLMQISNSIDHGSSGGALINEYGEVVGITSGTFVANSQANLNYAWSIDAVKPYLK